MESSNDANLSHNPHFRVLLMGIICIGLVLSVGVLILEVAHWEDSNWSEVVRFAGYSLVAAGSLFSLRLC